MEYVDISNIHNLKARVQVDVRIPAPTKLTARNCGEEPGHKREVNIWEAQLSSSAKNPSPPRPRNIRIG